MRGSFSDGDLGCFHILIMCLYMEVQISFWYPPFISFGFVVQSLSRVQLFLTPWAAAHQASLSITISQSLPKLMCLELVIPSNHLNLCCPLLLLLSIFPSIRVFSNESALCIRWPKYWSFSFNFSPSNEHPGLISFRMDWLDLLAVQGTLKSLLQHHSSKIISSIIIIFLIFWKTSTLFFIVTETICIPTDNTQCSFLSTSSPICVIFCLLDHSHSIKCEVISLCSFDFHFPYDKWCWDLFM